MIPLKRARTMAATLRTMRCHQVTGELLDHAAQIIEALCGDVDEQTDELRRVTNQRNQLQRDNVRLRRQLTTKEKTA